jgi:hypothetical protein
VARSRIYEEEMETDRRRRRREEEGSDSWRKGGR